MIAALAALLLAGAPPLSCPPGAERRGAAPPEAYEEWCEAKDAAGRPLRDGPARVYYDDGGLWREERFRAGRRDGPFTEWHRNGRTARQGSYADDGKTGRWTLFFESGAIEEESGWRNGVPHGDFVAWWPGGHKRTAGRHCGGAQCGAWRTWNEEGRPLGTVEYAEQGLTP